MSTNMVLDVNQKLMVIFISGPIISGKGLKEQDCLSSLSVPRIISTIFSSYIIFSASYGSEYWCGTPKHLRGAGCRTAKATEAP